MTIRITDAKEISRLLLGGLIREGRIGENAVVRVKIEGVIVMAAFGAVPTVVVEIVHPDVDRSGVSA
jgi:hypothetical protein